MISCTQSSKSRRCFHLLLHGILTVVLAIPVITCAEPREPRILSHTPITVPLKRQQMTMSFSTDSATQELLTVSTDNTDLSQLEVFEIPNPRRIVIDYPGNSARKNSLFMIKHAQAVKQVRIGLHPDKLRLVADMRSAYTSAYRWKVEGGRLSIFFPVANSAETTGEVQQPEPPIAKAKTAPPARQPLPSKDSTVPARVDTDSNTGLSSAKIAPGSKVKTPETAAEHIPSKSTPELIQLAFERFGADKTPVVVFKFNSAPEFNLIKKGKTLYELRIERCGLKDPSLELPYFPPHDFKGFAFINAARTEKGLKIRIAVEENTKIVSFVRENNIVIRTHQPG